MRRDLLAPLMGVAFIVLLVLSFAIGGEPPEADEPVQKIIDHYADDETQIIVGVVLSALAAVVLVFFANHLRAVMRASTTSATILVGAAMVAVGAAIDATITISLQSAAEDIDPSAVQALQALWDNDFLPIAVGIVVFLVSCGLSVLSTGALPRWLGWVAIALAVIGITPLGFAAFIGAGIWVLIASVMLAMRTGRTPAPAGGPPSG